MYKTSTSSYASKGFDFCLNSCLISNASDYFLQTSICVLHSNFWYLHINSLLEWRFYYFHMFRSPANQFMQFNPFPAVKTFAWTGAERHAWRNRYWRSRGQIVYRRNRRNGARLLQRTLNIWEVYGTDKSRRKRVNQRQVFEIDQLNWTGVVWTEKRMHVCERIG